MTPIDIAREIFPEADAATLNAIVWGRTGFPCFFRPGDGETIEDVLRRQLTEYRDAAARGTSLCDHCNEDAVPGDWACKPCGDAIRGADRGEIQSEHANAANEASA